MERGAAKATIELGLSETTYLYARVSGFC